MIDLLVIGAGSAGCALAARASENPALNVMLIDAGPDYETLAGTPFDLQNSHNNSYTRHDWGMSYWPTSQRQSPFPRGRVVGGSSSVNTTIALRGIPEDYDEWASLGNPEWSWEKVLPAFNRLERDLDYGSEPYHGDAGPITVRRYQHHELLPQHQAFLASAEALGYPECPDGNDPYACGAGPQPMNKTGRLRLSCAIGYLAPARLRDNLTIQGERHVRRLLINQHRCTGAEVELPDGSIEHIHARAVALCAGAIMSPVILMRSGLGAAAQLQKHGIDVVEDIPAIGQNLCDHPALSVVADVNDGAVIDQDSPLIQTILRYTCEGSDKRNDLQIEQISFASRAGEPPRFSVAGVVEYQYGRGQITLTSSDPHALPLIENRFCEDDRDAARLVQCMKDIFRFTETGPLADMITGIRFPDPSRGRDDETLNALVRKFSASGYHPCGTVKMGPAEDPEAIVDQYGCARKTDGLIVADGAIMPFVPRANTNLTCIMIGEKIGEWIRVNPARYGL
ncbi:MAG: GMC family oxidoreductase N-terminal domain-containing protein [Pseudomonadales bacterium]|nr:GMC family oxidoreductase N-terminal domain-containing protein [Pseudomonadales bacterium]